MIKCKDCKHLKETELGGQTYYECLKIWNVEIYDKDFEHLCNKFETKVNDVDTSHDKALNLAVVISSALPCPFCGGKDLQFISNVDGDRDVEFIVCMNNDCLCDGRIGKNKEEALSRWNARHCL
jgi:Lar family restriction alleviation protein